MAIKLEQRQLFTGTTTPLALAKKICDTNADAPCVCQPVALFDGLVIFKVSVFPIVTLLCRGSCGAQYYSTLCAGLCTPTTSNLCLGLCRGPEQGRQQRWIRTPNVSLIQGRSSPRF